MSGPAPALRSAGQMVLHRLRPEAPFPSPGLLLFIPAPCYLSGRLPPARDGCALRSAETFGTAIRAEQVCCSWAALAAGRNFPISIKLINFATRADRTQVRLSPEGLGPGVPPVGWRRSHPTATLEPTGSSGLECVIREPRPGPCSAGWPGEAVVRFSGSSVRWFRVAFGADKGANRTLLEARPGPFPRTLAVFNIGPVTGGSDNRPSHIKFGPHAELAALVRTASAFYFFMM